MDIKYEIKHKHTRYIVYKNGIEIGRADTKNEAQNLIEEDKAKRHQYRVMWIPKSSLLDVQSVELEAADETQAKIKVQQLHMNDLYKILGVEKIDGGEI